MPLFHFLTLTGLDLTLKDFYQVQFETPRNMFSKQNIFLGYDLNLKLLASIVVKQLDKPEE